MAPEIVNDISLGIRQKGESQNECFKKAKHAKISEKQTFLNPLKEMFVFRKFWRTLLS